MGKEGFEERGEVILQSNQEITILDDSTVVFAASHEPTDFVSLVRYHAQIRSELPELLAQLVQQEKRVEAIALLVAWGTHGKPNSEVWQEAKVLLGEAK